MPILDPKTYTTLCESATQMREQGVRLTAGYGGMDVVYEAARQAKLPLAVELIQISREQAHGIWDAYHGRAPASLE